MNKLEQAKSIIQAFRVSLKDKKVLSDEDTAQARLAICEGCDKLRMKDDRGKPWPHCDVCGCGYRRKIAFHGSKCPLGKW